MTSNQKALVASGLCGLALAGLLGMFVTDDDAPEVEEEEVDRERPEGAPPNIVVLLIDDAGYADFGMNGSPHFQTPAIDALAAEGVRFTAAYVTAPICSPSRAGILSGRYPQRFGHEFNPPSNAGPEAGLPVTVTTLADVLHERGYATAAIGKWHLGRSGHFNPTRRGFDSFYGFLNGERSYFPMTQRGPQDLKRGTRHVPESFDYLTDELASEASDWIGAHAHEPFFLYVAFNAVHMPLDALREDVMAQAPELTGERRTLAAMTAAVDRAIGHVLDALEREEIGDETVVFLLNDNGAGKQNHGDNAPFHGGKGNLYEGGIRVPYVVRWPGVTDDGTTFDAPVSALDIFPTALAAAGAPPREELDGVDLRPWLDGDRADAPHPLLFWRLGESWAIRDGSMKLLSDRGGTPQLFDLESDPGEQVDLSSQDPERVATLQRRYDAWNLQLAAPAFESATEERAGRVDKRRKRKGKAKAADDPDQSE
ncbi:MAG: sulfatase-like hydrolase/transferase [Myxococcota bacterium]